MGHEARMGLLLGATACLLVVLVDWVVQELAELCAAMARPGQA